MVDAPVRLTWRDLSVTLVPRRGPLHRVLDGLAGYAEPGGLTALMGPSGSGKSTLLDALAGRLATNAFVTGEILVNGRTSKLSFGAAAYVTQDDTLIGTLTVREMIRYSARLRLPDKMRRSEKAELVDSTIMEMGLQDCADTVIGNWHHRGISGGEKRRVSIALEILTKPRLLFLDEPTSGLDSASAFFVVKTLRSLSRDGRTVIASIHQPSSEVFMLFDYLCLLSGGKTIYFGRATQANEFFAQAGFPCPSFRNPSDHFLRCVNSDFDKVKSISKESNMGIKVKADEDDPLATTSAHEAIQRLIQYYSFSPYYHLVQEKIEGIAQDRGDVPDLAGSEASIFMQACTLTQRSFVNMSRDFGYYWLRLAMYVVLSICIGFTFLDVGSSNDSIQARASCSSFIFGFLTFMSIGGFPSFVEDMKVFQRERMNGHYGVAAFVIGNTLSAMPFLILIALMSGTICYFMVDFHPGFGHYFYFLLCLFASVAVVESLMMAIASIVPNFLMGIMIGASLQGFFMLVCGFFRLPNNIPKPVLRYPMTYISFLYWANQGQYQNDFKGLMFENQRPDLPKISGESVLENVFQIDLSRSKWGNLYVIFGMIIIYRTLFFAMIKISEDVAPLVRGFLARRRLQEKDRNETMSSQDHNQFPISITEAPRT